MGYFILSVVASCSISILLLAGCATEKVSTKKWKDYNRRASLALGEHNLALADGNYDLALQEAEKFGPGRKLSYSLLNLAASRFALQQYAEAERFAQRHLEIDQKIKLTNTIEFADSLSFLAECQDAQGQFDKAEQNYLRAEDIVRGLYPREYTAAFIAKRARLYGMQKRFADAESCYEVAKSRFETWARYLRPTSAQHTFVLARTADMLNDYGMLCEQQGNYAKAEDLLDQSLSILTHQTSKNSIRIIPVLNNLARVYGKNKELQKALATIQRSAAIAEKQLPTEDLLRIQTLKLRDEIQTQSASASL